MMLVVALVSHEGALRASLRAEYGIDLRNPGIGSLDLADLTVNLPPGCAFWQSFGGPKAWTDEVHALMMIEHDTRHGHWLQAGGKGLPPKPIEPPPFSGEERRRNAVAQRRAQRRAKRRSSG